MRVILNGAASRQFLVVNGYRADGSVVDVTALAKLSSSSPKVAKPIADATILPLGDGRGRIIARVGRVSATAPVTVTSYRKPVVWSFNNHIESVLTKQGCNSGTCHGSGSGKGGFKLTLRGYDPDLDYARISREGLGRRLIRTNPAESLILKKPSLGIAHVGGLKLRLDSLEYRVVADWIAAGAPGPNPRDRMLKRLDVYPRERIVTPGSKQRLQVTAVFSDGHTEDVSHWARYSSNEEPIASVDESGLVRMKRTGETAISVAYLGKVAFTRIAAPFPNRVPSASYRALLRSNPIDALVYNQLETMRLLPGPRSTDTEFVRRIFLDTIGTLPNPEETRAFLADSSLNKRVRLADELLARPEYVNYWTYKWADVLRVNRDLLGERGMWTLYRWLRDSVAENRPWDEIVRDLLTANGTSTNSGPANFYRLGSRPEEFAENVSQAFLGIRIQCAKCHNHPFEKWTQSDYYRMSGFFARVGRKVDKEDGGTIVFSTAKGDVNHPKLGHPIPPAAFDGPTLALDSKIDRRTFLAEWMISPQNPYFARTIVNRVWKHFLGRGLVEPVDDMRLTNPASNEPLLDWLARDFAANGFDVRRLSKLILTSQTYQASSKPNSTNVKDDRFYSRYLPRRLPAEVMLDAVCQVTAQPEKYPGIPAGSRSIALPDTQVRSAFLDVFGRPARQVTCECERNTEPNVAQALHLISAETINKKVAAKGGLVDRLVESAKGDSEIIDEIYAATLCRKPSRSEQVAVLTALQSATELNAGSSSGKAGSATAKPLDAQSVKVQVYRDLLWAVLSGPEFGFNH